MGKSGSVFYTGYGTLLNPNGVYLLGINPGGNPEEITESVAKNLHDFQYRNPYFNAYLDEDWGHKDFQRNIKDAFEKLNLCLRIVCCSNMVFERTEKSDDVIKIMNSYIYIQSYIINNIINPSVIIAVGEKTYHALVDNWTEQGKPTPLNIIDGKPVAGSPWYIESIEKDKLLCYMPHFSYNGHYGKFSKCEQAIESMRYKIHEVLNERDISHRPKWNFKNSWQSLFSN